MLTPLSDKEKIGPGARLFRVRIVLDLGQSSLPAASLGSIGLVAPAELDWEEKPSRRSFLKDIGTRIYFSS